MNADLIVGQFGFHQNQTSSCAGITAGCTPLANTGFDVASFALGYATIKDRRLFDAPTYTEKRPEIAAYIQDDIRIGSKLTVNAGLRWDLFVPWVEVDDRQSNFDVSTGRFVVASPDAVINGVKVGRYLQTYSKRDFGPRCRRRLRSVRRRPHDPARRLRHLLELLAGRHLVVEGAESAVPPVDDAHDQSRHEPAARRTGSRRRPASIRIASRRARRARSFDINFRDAYAHNFNVNVQRQLGELYMVEVAYAGSRGRQLPLKGDPNQPIPTLGVTDNNVNRPYIRVSPQLRTVGQLVSQGFVDYNGLLMKFQRRYANNFSTLTSYTFARSEDYNSDNDGLVTLTNVYDKEYDRGPSQYDVTHTFELHGDL